MEINELKQKSTFERVAYWNTIADKTPSEVNSESYWAALENQVGRIQEELDETLKAIRERNPVEVLDGGCDLDVTVAGLNFLHGLPYEEAIDRVLSNNDVKVTTDFEVAYDTQKHYETLHHPIECTISQVDEGGNRYFSVHRLKDDKIMKLLNHPRVDLTDLVGGDNA